MKRLQDSLSESFKELRRRRTLINIHITILGWIIEFSGFFFIVLGSFVLGHNNTTVTLCLQAVTVFIFFDVLPCIFLINDSDLKADMAESSFYINVLRMFKCEGNPSIDTTAESVDRNNPIPANIRNEDDNDRTGQHN